LSSASVWEYPRTGRAALDHKEGTMTGKADFTPEEWETIAQGPPTAGLIVITAQRGGLFRETLALTRAYVDLHKEHGQTELIDEIVSTRPDLDHSRYGSADELKQAGVEHLRAAVALLEQRATADEVSAYKTFVIDLATKVASAHREHGKEISDAEQAALDEVAAALASPS
jgi:hypothetical protein